MKFISKPLSILESTMFIDEIVSWAFGEDGVYNPFRRKLGTYMAVLHYCVEDLDTENMGLTELYDYIYTDRNSDEINAFIAENPQIYDLDDAASEAIEFNLDIAKRKTKLDDFIEKVETYMEEHPEFMNNTEVTDNDTISKATAG